MAEVKYPNPPPYSPPVSSEPQYAYYQPNPAITTPRTDGQPRTIVITDTPAVILINNLGPNPISCFCNTCNQQIITYTQKETSIRTHILAGLLCIFGCWLCVWIPYCTDACKKTYHYCPQCNSYLGCNSNV